MFFPKNSYLLGESILSMAPKTSTVSSERYVWNHHQELLNLYFIIPTLEDLGFCYYVMQSLSGIVNYLITLYLGLGFCHLVIVIFAQYLV